MLVPKDPFELEVFHRWEVESLDCPKSRRSRPFVWRDIARSTATYIWHFASQCPTYVDHWTHGDPKVCKLQHGSTMIYVSYGGDQSMGARLAIAQATIEAAMGEVSSVLAFAQSISEHQHSGF